MEREQVFISYSHKDKVWLDKLRTMLKPMIRNQKIFVWDDTKIQAGAKWKEEIEQALARASVAVLMVSPDFLASDFIADHELPPLLDAARKEGVKIIWIPITYCLYDETEIGEYQAVYNPKQPLDTLNPADLNKALVKICKEIKTAVTESSQNP
ncbi:MAG: toll/interleukin-1 receptor domain-containing protein [Coleofasciculus sp. C1-SOL-03]|uniref:toll/interleukin-1 receptor domain-containing protein n=1 Tax=Coleofasciculus sp. C1-SOL-03 TaxID=3069522 RepID=UPI0033051025